jgi:hypothetical protein
VRADAQLAQQVRVEIRVDTVAAMKGLGQYIYVSVLKASHPRPEPLLKFNSGVDGGSPGVLFDRGYERHPDGRLGGLCDAVIKPALRAQL